MKVFFSKTRPAESLIEVVVAIFVLGIGVGIAAILITTAFQANNYSRDNLVAMNLAAEGIEAMRSIRDTNWLKYSFDRKNCWNLLPGFSCSAPYRSIESSTYVPYLDANNVWQLEKIEGGPLDLRDGTASTNEWYRLKTVDLFGDAKVGFYVPKQYSCTSPCISLPEEKEDLRFYRMIKVTNEPDDTSVEAQTIQSLVQWRSQGITHQVVLITQLTPYQP